MRVALDVSSAPAHLAGAGRYMRELADRLPGEDVATTLVTRRHDTKRWSAWSPAATLAPIVPDQRVPRLVYEAWGLGTSATARRADVWHAPHYTMPRRGSTPTVVTVHDLTFFTNPEWHERSKVSFFRRALRYSASHASVVVSVSDFTARLIDDFLPDHAPVVVAPHGVDLRHFSLEGFEDEALFRAHALPVGVPYVLFVGTAEPRKGLDVLLRAFDEIARGDSSLELWIAGQAGWGARVVDDQLLEPVARSRIRRLGFVPDEVLPALLRRSRLVAYPSRGEGFGLPVLEALACGAMVVTSRATVMADVADGAATLATPGDETELRDALASTLALNDEARALRSRVGRARASLFTWDASLAQHLAAYHLALGGG